MTMMLYVLRHGDSVFNAAGKAEGHHDSALTAAAIEYTLAAADRLKQEPWPPQAIWSSDLPRGYYTAALVAERIGLDYGAVHRSGLLREVNYGEMAGTPFDQFPQRYRDDMDALFPGGESRNLMRMRVLYFVERQIAAAEVGSVLIIAHGGSLRALLSRYAGEDFKSSYDSALKKEIFRFELEHGVTRRHDRL